MVKKFSVVAFNFVLYRFQESEFNPNLRRPRMSKNRATYGIWAENSDDDDDPGEEENLAKLFFKAATTFLSIDARPSFGFGGGGGRKGGKNYTAPVGFVSAGIQGSAKDAKKKALEGESKEEEEEDPLEGSSSMFRRGGRGQGDSSGEDDDGGSGFGFRGRRGFGGGGKKAKVDQQSDGPIAGMRKGGSNYRPNMGSGLGKGFGDWEKHTRGIGAKLLMQMGYEAGKGLGKDLQGRSTIVEAHLRKGRGAIGAYGHEGGGPKAQNKKK